jgi:hypothetical protein
MVLRCGDLAAGTIGNVLSLYGIRISMVAPDAPIPGSYWGEPEAGIAGERLYLRSDTPVHSALHEACHIICMTPGRRSALNGDAGGDDQEENGVCYLQVVLAGCIPGVGRDRMFRDMDAWGYTFRLGSAADWFRHDAADARLWLRRRGLIDSADRPTWRLRGQGPEATPIPTGANSS